MATSCGFESHRPHQRNFTDKSTHCVQSARRSKRGPLETFEVGHSFFERPGAIHLVSANATNTEPAELIAVFVADEGAELTTLLDR